MYRLTLIALTILMAGEAGAQATAAAPVKPWSGSAGAGMAVTSGNSDTSNFNLSLKTTWDPKTVRLFKAEALYLRGESNGVKQLDKASASGRYERTVSDRTFWFGELSYLRDPLKAINYLISPIAGAGYYLVKTDAKKLSFDGGVGAAMESNAGTGSQSSLAFKGGQSFELVLSPVSKATERLSGLWKTQELADALYHFDAGITTTVARRADLQVSYVYDYKNKPRVLGVKKGDSALFAALLFKF